MKKKIIKIFGGVIVGMAILYIILAVIVLNTSRCVEGNCDTGIGRKIYSDGEEYFGEFANRKRSGQGVLKLAVGGVIEGYWENDKLNGPAKHEYLSGNIFQGTYRDGKKEGPGILQIGDELKLYGNWHEGGLEGKVVLEDKSGNKYLSIQKNGKVESGAGLYVYEDRTYYIGEWSEGKRHGKGLLFSAVGQPLKGGDWQNDQLIILK